MVLCCNSSAQTGRVLRLVTSQSDLIELQISGRVRLKNREQHSRLMSGLPTHICSCTSGPTHMHAYTWVHTTNKNKNLLCVGVIIKKRIFEWFEGTYLTTHKSVSAWASHFITQWENAERSLGYTCRIMRKLSISRMVYQHWHKLSLALNSLLGLHSPSIALSSM